MGLNEVEAGFYGFAIKTRLNGMRGIFFIIGIFTLVILFVYHNLIPAHYRKVLY